MRCGCLCSPYHAAAGCQPCYRTARIAEKLNAACCGLGGVSVSAIRKERTVSQYTLEELIARWKQEDLTADQMIGQLLLALQTLQQRMRDVERRLPPAIEGTASTPRRPTQ